MTKSLVMDPKELLAPGKIHFEDIDVNQYNKTIADEKKAKNYTNEDLMRIWRDMRIIREFETMLNEVKTKNNYMGIDYSNPGPAHLSIGQEAAAVGEAYLLDTNDFIFGSHRSHGEILAKGLSAIEKLSEEEVYAIMKDFFGGQTLKVVEERAEAGISKKELAIRFLLYGALAEVFARTTGFNLGFGGSMHAFFTPFGIYPNNAIVGGAVPVALGAALYKACNAKSGVVVANFGDGSLGCGPVLEALNMSKMDQIEKLWEEGYNKGLPLIFHVNNNHYGMGGQTCGETMAYGQVARVGAGVNASQLHAERVNGFNPLAVIDAYRRKKKIVEEGNGPVLLDVVTYRFSGHSPSDSDSYRTQEEKQLWMDIDPIKTYKEALIEAKVGKEADFEKMEQEIIERMVMIFKLAIDEEISPRLDLKKDPDAIARLMFTNEKVMSYGEGEVVVGRDVYAPMEENPHVQEMARKARTDKDENGKPLSAMKTCVMKDALFEAVIQKFYEDNSLIAYGEDCRDWGGAFGVYKKLEQSIPYHRFFNSPISEAAIVGSAVGYAMMGGRALVELMYCDFMGRAGDEIFNQLAKWQSMSGDIIKMPVVLRVSVGSKYGAQHSQDWTALAAHIPGLKVVFPATPYDAKGLLTSALNGSDPVIFFESQRLYNQAENFHEGGVPRESYEIEIGEPDIKVEGSDVTIITIGATLYKGVEAAKKLKEQYGISAEVIDARSLVPFNYEKVLESVKKTGKVVLASDACARGSYLNDIARNITELAFDYLDAPPVVVGARNWITPCYELDADFFPQADWIIDAIHERIMPIPGYVAHTCPTESEQVRREKLGV